MNEDYRRVNSKRELMQFLRELAHDCKEDSANWENVTVEHYLESISAWMEGLDPDLESENRWAAVAKIFIAGKYYE